MGGVEGLPFTQLASEEPVAGLAHATPEYVVKDCLRNLKKGFWPWEWSPQDSYGFVNAAQAALGQVRGTPRSCHTQTSVTSLIHRLCAVTVLVEPQPVWTNTSTCAQTGCARVEMVGSQHDSSASSACSWRLARRQGEPAHSALTCDRIAS
jgi:hypothetical protein